MHLSFALVLSAALPAQANLDFSAGRLTPWEGEGFHLVSVPLRGVSSGDDGPIGHTARLQRTLVLPADVGAVTFQAAVIRPESCKAGPILDITLEGPDHRLAPRQVRRDKELRPAPQILPPLNGKPREYVWSLEGFAGKTVRITLLDQDDRPGCYVIAGAFRIWSRDEFNGKEFSDFMLRLCRDRKLPPAARFTSRHFLAISNADEAFTRQQLSNCEKLYDVFYDHFRRKGFSVTRPAGKLMLAIFDGPQGFEAYMGKKMSNIVTGIYHPASNRLVVYDYGQNRSFKENSDKAQARLRQVPPTLEGKRAMDAVTHNLREFREDTNIGTIMHELAHQLSFNGGLVNRQGDVPVWLAEGLACYCEGTEGGRWLGIGAANPHRIATLAKYPPGEGPILPLRSLVSNDDWLHQPDEKKILLGYARSWALFRMLMEERPAALRKYMAMVYARRTPDHRFADFAESFGDFIKLEKRYEAYLREIVQKRTK